MLLVVSRCCLLVECWLIVGCLLVVCWLFFGGLLVVVCRCCLLSLVVVGDVRWSFFAVRCCCLFLLMLMTVCCYWCCSLIVADVACCCSVLLWFGAVCCLSLFVVVRCCRVPMLSCVGLVVVGWVLLFVVVVA